MNEPLISFKPENYVLPIEKNQIKQNFVYQR